MAARTRSTPRPVLLGDEVAALRAVLPATARERRATHAALPGVALDGRRAVEPRKRRDDEKGRRRREAARRADVEESAAGPCEGPLCALFVEFVPSRADEDLAAQAAGSVRAARDAEEEAEDAVAGRAVGGEAGAAADGRGVRATDA